MNNSINYINKVKSNLNNVKSELNNIINIMDNAIIMNDDAFKKEDIENIRNTVNTQLYNLTYYIIPAIKK